MPSVAAASGGAVAPVANPRVFRLFLNYACNAKCPFCFNPPDAPEWEVRGMPLRTALAVLRRAYGEGLRAVSFIGGEPTVRGDFLKIVAAARRLGFEDLQLVTNGVRLAEPAYVRALVRAGLRTVDVSIHAADPALHDRMLALPGAHQRALRALEILQGHPIRLGVNIVVTAWNYRVLPETVIAFLDRGIRNFSIFGLRYIGYMTIPENRKALRVSMSEAARYVRRALEQLRGAGCLETTYVTDFPPCILPEFVDRIVDWERGANLDSMVHPDGGVADSEPVVTEGKRPVAACAHCDFGQRCLGVEASYLALFGESEFKPVGEIADCRARIADGGCKSY